MFSHRVAFKVLRSMPSEGMLQLCELAPAKTAANNDNDNNKDISREWRKLRKNPTCSQRIFSLEKHY